MNPTLSHRKVAVTGANGFIGSAVADLLLASGAQVTGFCGTAPVSLVRYPYPSLTADISDKDAVNQFVRNQEIIIHLAGPPSVAASFENPVEYVRVHAQGTANLLAAAVQADVHRFVYVSSAEVYGNPRSEFVEEDHPLQSRSPYAAAKICAEKLVEAYRFSHGLETVILRPFSVYGPGSSPHSVLSKICHLALANKPILLNDLRPVRDYCYVSDLAAAVAQACQTSASGTIFNIGTMRATSVRQLAETVLDVLGSPLPVGQMSHEKGDRPGGSDILRLVANNQRAAKSLPWAPTTSLEEGLKQLLSRT